MTEEERDVLGDFLRYMGLARHIGFVSGLESCWAMGGVSFQDGLPIRVSATWTLIIVGYSVQCLRAGALRSLDNGWVFARARLVILQSG